MSIPKRHHYLPQFYLEHFCRDGSIWIFDRDTKKYRRDGTQNTAVISHYYSAEGIEGERRADIEAMFARIEGAAAPVINKLSCAEPITTTEKEELSLFLGFFVGRVPQFERMIQEAVEPLIKRITQVAFATPERAQDALEQVAEHTGEPVDITHEQLEGLVDFAQRGDYGVETHRNFSLYSMLNMGMEVSNCLRQMDWFVLHAPAEKSFVTTDAPFTLAPPPDQDPSSLLGVGITTPGAIKLFPLTQNTSLWMGDHGQILAHVQLNEDHVRLFNLTVASRCDRLVIGRDKELVRSIVEATGIEHSEPDPLLRVF